MGPLLVLAALLLGGPAPATGFGWPLAGAPVVERGFAPPTTAWGAGHRGVDLCGSLGQQVLSAGPGQVSYAGVLAGRGVVVVTHAGGLRTTYEPVTASVRVGQQVGAGAVLGSLGTGHASCRPGSSCLHWGLRRGEAYLDPLALLSAPQLRLLPLGADPGPAAAAGGAPAQAAARPPLEAAAPAQRSRPGRQVAAAAAAGSLLLGVGLLAGRTPRPGGPAPGGAPPPVDLRAERARRRAA